MDIDMVASTGILILAFVVFFLASVSEWEILENISQDYAQRELAKYYFCPRGLIVGSPEEAIRALKAGAHPNALR